MSEPLRTGLSMTAKALALFVGAMVALVFLSGGTPETRIVFAVALVAGLLSPLWNLYALALLGGLYLTNIGASPAMTTVDGLALGIVMGEITRWNTRAATTRSLWPAWLFGAGVLVVVSGWPGFVQSLAPEWWTPGQPWLRSVTQQAAFGWHSDPSWFARGLFNWLTGFGVAISAARRLPGRPFVTWCALAIAGVVVCCVAGLLAELAARTGGWFSLEWLRQTNLDIFHVGRFQFTAGHAGWFGEWMVLVGPALVVLGERGGTRSRLAVSAVALFLVVCLVLTSARAAWFAGLVAVGVLALGMLAIHRRWRTAGTLVGIVGIAALLGIGAMTFDASLSERLGRAFRISDRFNYYATASLMLSERPLGAGMGQHVVLHKHWINEANTHYFQHDRDTTHSLPLHILTEMGPLMLLWLLAGLGGMAIVAWRGWRDADAARRVRLLACIAALAGILVEGLAQYFFYIRTVELGFWMLAGVLVGEATAARPDSPATVCRSRPLVLALGGGLAAVMLLLHVHRTDPEFIPRPWTIDHRERGSSYAVWTPRVWRVPVEGTTRDITFTLYRVGTPTVVTVRWPDGAEHRYPIAADGWFRVWHRMEPIHDGPRRYDRRRWLEVEVDSTFTPGRWEPGADPRPLGVYINEFWIGYLWDPDPDREQMTGLRAPL